MNTYIISYIQYIHTMAHIYIDMDIYGTWYVYIYTYAWCMIIVWMNSYLQGETTSRPYTNGFSWELCQAGSMTCTLCPLGEQLVMWDVGMAQDFGSLTLFDFWHFGATWGARKPHACLVLAMSEVCRWHWFVSWLLGDYFASNEFPILAMD